MTPKVQITHRPFATDSRFWPEAAAASNVDMVCWPNSRGRARGWEGERSPPSRLAFGRTTSPMALTNFLWVFFGCPSGGGDDRKRIFTLRDGTLDGRKEGRGEEGGSVRLR